MKQTIKEIGTINVESLEVAEGDIEMRMPVEAVSEQLDATLDRFYTKYQEMHPNIPSENIAYEVRIVFQFNRLNPEFSLMLIIFNSEDNGAAEVWDELEITLSEDAKKQFRKIAWDKLGEALFNL